MAGLLRGSGRWRSRRPWSCSAASSAPARVHGFDRGPTRWPARRPSGSGPAPTAPAPPDLGRDVGIWVRCSGPTYALTVVFPLRSSPRRPFPDGSVRISLLVPVAAVVTRLRPARLAATSAPDYIGPTLDNPRPCCPFPTGFGALLQDRDHRLLVGAGSFSLDRSDSAEALKFEREQAEVVRRVARVNGMLVVGTVAVHRHVGTVAVGCCVPRAGTKVWHPSPCRLRDDPPCVGVAVCGTALYGIDRIVSRERSARPSSPVLAMVFVAVQLSHRASSLLASVILSNAPRCRDSRRFSPRRSLSHAPRGAALRRGQALQRTLARYDAERDRVPASEACCAPTR